MDVKETAEDVLTDLQRLDLAGLRLMCLHRSLSTEGDKVILFNRLKSFFGFEVESLESETTSKASNEQGESLSVNDWETDAVFYRCIFWACFASKFFFLKYLQFNFDLLVSIHISLLP